MCRPYGFGTHVDMTETALRPITNSGMWTPMLAPTCSSMISSDEPRCRGLNQSRIQFPLSIGTLLARDSIVGIPIPCSVSLPASHFTRTVMHDPATNLLVTMLARLIVMCITERAEIPLRYTEWQILISIYANLTNTFGDTYRASLYHPVTLWHLIAHKVFLRYSGVA